MIYENHPSSYVSQFSFLCQIFFSSLNPANFPRCSFPSSSALRYCIFTIMTLTEQQFLSLSVKILSFLNLKYQIAFKIVCQQSLFPDDASSKEPAYVSKKCKRGGFDPRVGKIPWRRAQQPTPIFLPGESYGQRSWVGYSTEGRKELDINKVT